MCSRIDGPMPNLGAWRILAEIVIAFAIRRGADGSRDKAAAAIRTYVRQDSLDTFGAKRAFIATDTRIRGVGRQRLVAVLARRSQFEHRDLERAFGRRQNAG